MISKRQLSAIMEAGMGGTGELGSMQTQKEHSLMRLRVQVKQSRQLVFLVPTFVGPLSSSTTGHLLKPTSISSSPF
jgi:hypothetical protein